MTVTWHFADGSDTCEGLELTRDRILERVVVSGSAKHAAHDMRGPKGLEGEAGWSCPTGSRLWYEGGCVNYEVKA